MQWTNILHLSCAIFALLISPALGRADDIGFSNLQVLSDSNGILNPAVTSGGSAISAHSPYQNSLGSQEESSSTAAPFYRDMQRGPLQPMISSARPERTDGVTFPALAGTTPSSGAFVDPIAFCGRAPSPSPSPVPEPGTLVLLSSGLMVIAFRRCQR